MGESESALLISAIESSVRMIGAGEKVRLQFPARALSFAKPIRRSTSSCNAKREPTSSFVKFNSVRIRSEFLLRTRLASSVVQDSFILL